MKTHGPAPAAAHASQEAASTGPLAAELPAQGAAGFLDRRPSAVAQQRAQSQMNHGPKAAQLQAMQHKIHQGDLVGASAVLQQKNGHARPAFQMKQAPQRDAGKGIVQRVLWTFGKKVWKNPVTGKPGTPVDAPDLGPGNRQWQDGDTFEDGVPPWVYAESKEEEALYLSKGGWADAAVEAKKKPALVPKESKSGKAARGKHDKHDKQERTIPGKPSKSKPGKPAWVPPEDETKDVHSEDGSPVVESVSKVKFYRTMPADEYRFVMLERKVDKLKKHLGDRAEAMEYLVGDSADLVKYLVEFEIETKQLKLFFSPATLALPEASGTVDHTVTDHMRAVFARQDAAIETAEASEGNAKNRIGVKSEAKGESGFSIMVGSAGQHAKKFMKFVRKMTLVATSTKVPEQTEREIVWGDGAFSEVQGKGGWAPREAARRDVPAAFDGPARESKRKSAYRSGGPGGSGGNDDDGDSGESKVTVKDVARPSGPPGGGGGGGAGPVRGPVGPGASRSGGSGSKINDESKRTSTSITVVKLGKPNEAPKGTSVTGGGRAASSPMREPKRTGLQGGAGPSGAVDLGMVPEVEEKRAGPSGGVVKTGAPKAEGGIGPGGSGGSGRGITLVAPSDDSKRASVPGNGQASHTGKAEPKRTGLHGGARASSEGSEGLVLVEEAKMDGPTGGVGKTGAPKAESKRALGASGAGGGGAIGKSQPPTGEKKALTMSKVNPRDRATRNGRAYYPNTPKIRDGGECFWDTMEVRYKISAEHLQAAAARTGNTYGQHMYEHKIWPFLIELSRHTGQKYSLILEKFSHLNLLLNLGTTRVGTGPVKIAIGFFVLESEGHYVPPTG